jgi:cell filamentation protein
MRNEYKYLDHDYVYTHPKTGVLRNIGNIADADALSFAETGAVTKRAGELKTKPIRIDNAETLFAIHQYLFQDIYAWAGKRRTVEISKGGKQFFPLSRFDTALSYIDALIAGYKRLGRDEKEKLSRKLAEILDAVNYLHPFREGNGRTQRELLRLLAWEKGWKLNLNPPDSAEIYERYMAGTIDGDIDLLEKLIFECLNRMECPKQA